MTRVDDGPTTPDGARPRDLWDVPGQERAVAVLRGAVERGEVGHAWALTGPSGVGQELLARALVAALACEQAGSPCGVCDVCGRARRGAHGSYSEFVPTGAAHRVVEVREQWLATALRTPSEGTHHVLRIVDADRMNEAAANAFLKVLEEPPPATTWLLDIADPEELPDTILSRCRELRLSPWRPDVLDAEARRLGLADAAERALAVRACLGHPAALARLATPGGLDDLRGHRSIPGRLRREGSGAALVCARLLDDEVRRRTAALKAQGKAELEAIAETFGDRVPPAVAKQLAERHARREREARTVVVQAALDDVVGWYRDCLALGGGAPDTVAIHADAAAEVRADAEALGAARILAAVDRVLVTRETLERNVATVLALEACFLDLAALSMGR